MAHSRTRAAAPRATPRSTCRCRPACTDAEYETVFDAVWYPAAGALRAGRGGAAGGGRRPVPRSPGPLQALHARLRRGRREDRERRAARHADGTPRLLVTGGGGYHLLGVARAWTAVWALLSGRDLPDSIPAAGAEAMRATGWDLDEDEPWYPGLFLSRFDAPTALPVRSEMRQIAGRIRRHRYFASW
ncbi:MAG: hypothetical protein MZW92_49920 [Comamonadaceae bacterium]|nr:hypothetical protein [Comamonadaceae bacterium]